MNLEVMGKIESLALRVPTFELIKHLIVGGNVLTYLPSKGNMRVKPPLKHNHTSLHI